MQDAPKSVWSIPYVSVAFFPSLKQTFIAYYSFKMSSRLDCVSSRPDWLNSVFCDHHHHHHQVVPPARISLTLSRHFFLSFIAFGRSSGLHPVSSHYCCMYVRAGRPAFAWPYVGVHRSTSLMSSSLLLQQCPAYRVTRRLPFQLLIHQSVGEGATCFPGLLHFTLDTHLLCLSVKRVGIKYHFKSLYGN